MTVKPVAALQGPHPAVFQPATHHVAFPMARFVAGVTVELFDSYRSNINDTSRIGIGRDSRAADIEQSDPEVSGRSRIVDYSDI